MSLVAIIGAGEIGGAVARALASRARIGVIRLIDDNAPVAAGKALDLTQAGPISRSDTRIDAASDLGAAAGASAIVLADPAGPGTEWSGEAALALLRRLKAGGHLDQSVLICAAAHHRTVMQQGFDELGLSRRRVVGFGPRVAGRHGACAGGHRSASGVQSSSADGHRQAAREAGDPLERSVGGRPQPHIVAQSSAAESSRAASAWSVAAWSRFPWDRRGIIL